MVSHCGFDFIFLMMSDVENRFMSLLTGNLNIYIYSVYFSFDLYRCGFEI